MDDAQTRQSVEAALERLSARIASPRALTLKPDDKAALDRAVERAKAQLLGGPEPTLTVALAGGTGAGKSSLINALAGAAIAESGVRRPTTTRIRVYHHREVEAGGLPAELAGQASFAAHDRPELRNKVIVDTPDLDSYATEHRLAAKALLKAAGLVLYVFNPQNYRDERVWGVLAEERRFSHCAAVLNKADLASPEELEAITEDLRGCFARIGLRDIRIFRTVAAGESRSGVNDLSALRAYLERELAAGDVARMIAGQRSRVIGHLAAEVERIAPADMLARFDRAAAGARGRIDAAAGKLTELLSPRLRAVEQELAPVTVMRLHERFRGPLRTWLAVSDFFRYGLSGIVRTLLGRAPRGDRGAVEDLLSRGPTSTIDNLLRAETLAVQDALFAAGLPISRWAAESARADAGRLTAGVAGEVEARFDAALSDTAGRGRVVVWLGSLLGGLVPAGFVGYGLYVMTEQLLSGDPSRYAGLPFLGHLAAMVVLFFLALHGVVGALLPSVGRLTRGIGNEAARAVLTRTLGGMLDRCRTDLAADLADLHESVASLRAAVPAPAPPELPAPPAAASAPARPPNDFERAGERAEPAVRPPAVSPERPAAGTAPAEQASISGAAVPAAAAVPAGSPARLDLAARLREAEKRRAGT